MGDLGDIKTKANEKKYCCEICDFFTLKKTDYTRHLSTNKHIMNIKNREKERNGVVSSKQNESKYCCEQCNYTTNDLTKYTRHCNTIKHKKTVENRDNNIVNNSNSSDNIVVSKEVFLQLMQDNQEFKRMMLEQSNQIVQQNNQLLEQNNKIIEISQNITNNTTNNNNNTLNNNTVNQKFNLNLYLNETCKNAMNWSDFINGIQINQDDLLYNGPLGFPNAMSNVILSNLNQLESTERPIHCTDLKRKSIYIKDDNTWELQKNHDKFYKAVDTISDKFKDTYMDSQEDPDMSTEKEDALMISCRNIMMTGEHIETIPKIVNTVLKNVTIDKK